MTDERAHGEQATAPALSRDAARAAFIARVTGGATHEFRNLFAITKESAGLVGDLLGAAGPGGGVPAEKVAWALDRIRLQVRRGTELTDSLNRLMHGLDHPTEPAELGAALRNAALLARRFAQRTRTEIQVEEGPELTVVVNVLDLYRTLVELMEWSAARLPEGGRVIVRPESADGGPAVRFTAEPVSPPDDPGDTERLRLDGIVASVGAGWEQEGTALLLLLTETSGG